MANQPSNTPIETQDQQFENVLSRNQFTGLKAVLNCLASDRARLYQSVKGTHSYEQLVERLGFRITLTKQIHVQDCYSRVGQAGGIRAVLPYHDIPTQSSLPTLVNLASTGTTTPK